MRQKPYLAVLVALAAWSDAQTKKPAAKAAAPAPNQALLQKGWDGWGTLDVTNVEQYYVADRPHTCFDITAAQLEQLGRVPEGRGQRAGGLQDGEVHREDDAEKHVPSPRR